MHRHGVIVQVEGESQALILSIAQTGEFILAHERFDLIVYRAAPIKYGNIIAHAQGRLYIKYELSDNEINEVHNFAKLTRINCRTSSITWGGAPRNVSGSKSSCQAKLTKHNGTRQQ